MVYDIDRSEIYALLFNEEMSSTESRKRLYGVSALIDRLKEEGFESITDDEMLNKIKEQTLEFEKEKVKFQDQRREYYKLVRTMSRDEHIIGSIQDAAEQLNQSKRLSTTNIRNIIK